MPGLVGTSAPWLRCGRSINDWYGRREWVALEGEPGVGKLSLARAVHLRHRPTGLITVFDVPDIADVESWLDDVSEALAEDGDAVIFRHVDRLDRP